MPPLKPHQFDSHSETLAREEAARAHPYSGRGVTAVLGPTNTGKTHLAIERMIAHPSGLIGLPLRLLAREVYTRLVERVGEGAVSLITGEEKIRPPNARYSVCTVEALPRTTRASFVAIDEVQLAGDLSRGHVFTDRILNLRGLNETLLLGAATMRGILTKLLPGLNVLTRPRMSHLAYAGSKKITRLPRKSAIVAFSADEVYAIAELIRRQRGGAAVVLGALSPRTRNAQVELFQSGDVEFLVATDAIGMGLNLDLDHVAFAQDHKFDGFQTRPLTPAEMAQVAGRAGRHVKDGTFGVTGRADPLTDETVTRIESHDFAPVKTLQWRSPTHDFSTLEALRASIEAPPEVQGLSKALPAHDVRALEILARDEGLMRLANTPLRVKLLWEACALPDYRRIAPAQHAELISAMFRDLATRGHVDEEFMAGQVSRADRTDGEIDTLSARISQIRTWTFVSHRPNWLRDPKHWQGVTREVEDRLSDALHERLTKRFVDRRTSVLMRRLRENAVMEAEIGPDGDVHVEGHAVGHLEGFRFRPDRSAEGQDAKAVAAASQRALALEYEARAARLGSSPNSDFALSSDGTIRWQGQVVGQLAPGDDTLRPRVVLLADDALTGPSRDKVAARIERHVRHQIETLLKPLIDLRDAPHPSDAKDPETKGDEPAAKDGAAKEDASKDGNSGTKAAGTEAVGAAPEAGEKSDGAAQAEVEGTAPDDPAATSDAAAGDTVSAASAAASVDADIVRSAAMPSAGNAVSAGEAPASDRNSSPDANAPAADGAAGEDATSDAATTAANEESVDSVAATGDRSARPGRRDGGKGRKAGKNDPREKKAAEKAAQAARQPEGTLGGTARGLAFRLVEEFGIIPRREVAEEVRSLDQPSRAVLRRFGVRFGFYHIFLPALLKPGPAEMMTLLWALKNDKLDAPGHGEVVPLLASGRTSVVVDPSFEKQFYKLAGFRVMGGRAVRIDILERLADLIRPAVQWEPGKGKRPEAGFDGRRFITTPGMMSILGAKEDDLAVILKALGYRGEPVKASEVAAQLEKVDGGHPPFTGTTEGGVKVERKEKSRRKGAGQKAGGEGAAASAPNGAATAGEDAGAEGALTEATTAGPLQAAVEALGAAAGEALDAAKGAVEAATGGAGTDGGAKSADDPKAAEPAVETQGAETTSGAGTEAGTEPPVSASGDDQAASSGEDAAPTEKADAPVGKSEGETGAEGTNASSASSDGASPSSNDAAAGAEGGSTADASPAPEEEPTVLVWRQGPPPGARGRGRRDGRGQEGARENRGGRRRAGAGGQQGVDAKGGDGGQNREAKRGPGGNRDAADRPGGKGPGRPGGKGQGYKGGGRGGPGGKGGPGKGGPGGKRGREEWREHAGAGNRPRRERGPDPDSPFAKLAALKGELGKK